MNINFTGIHNVYSYTKSENKQSSYTVQNIFPDEVMESKENNFSNQEFINVSMNLSDDINGKHLNKFHSTLRELKPCYQFNCRNRNDDSMVSVTLKKNHDKYGKYTVMYLNNYELMTDELEIVPAYTFVKSLMSQIVNDNKNLYTETQKLCAGKIYKDCLQKQKILTKNFNIQA